MSCLTVQEIACLPLQVTALPPHAVVIRPEDSSIIIASTNPEPQPGSSTGPLPQEVKPGVPCIALHMCLVLPYI